MRHGSQPTANRPPHLVASYDTQGGAEDVFYPDVPTGGGGLIADWWGIYLGHVASLSEDMTELRIQCFQSTDIPTYTSIRPIKNYHA